LANAGDGSDAQAPILFLANSVPPPRITAEGKAAVRAILANLGRTRLDVAALDEQYEMAASLVGEHPEARLAYALVLYRHRKQEEALRPLEDVRSSKPEALPAHQLWCWIKSKQGNHRSVLTGLHLLASQPKPPRNPSFPEETLRLFEWVGALRDYTMVAAGAGDEAQLSQLAARLDAAMEQHGGQALQRYQQGRQSVQLKWADYGKQIDAAIGIAQSKLRVDRTLVTSYLDFDVEEASAQLVEKMNE
jgi:hypothetical protein